MYVITQRIASLDLPYTWGLPARRLLRYRVPATETEVADSLDEVATNRIHGTLGGQQSRSLRSCLLHLEKTDPSAIPDADSTWSGARC